MEARREKIAVVALSLLTTSYHTITMDPREDHVRGNAEQMLVKDFVTAVEGARWHELDTLFARRVGAVRTDMGLKAVEWLAGTMRGGLFQSPWKVHATGPLYGACGMVASL